MNKSGRYLLNAFRSPIYLFFISSAFSTNTGCGNSTHQPNCPLAPSSSRPVTGGTFIYGKEKGTLGMFVHDRATGKPMLLTNCHVVSANCFTGDFKNTVYLGDNSGPILGTPTKGGGSAGTEYEDWAVAPLRRGWDYSSDIQMFPNLVPKIAPAVDKSEAMYYEPQMYKEVVTGKVALKLNPIYFDLFPDNLIGTNPPPAQTGDSGTIVLDQATAQPIGISSGNLDNQPNLNVQALTDALSTVKANAHYYDPRTNPVGFFRYKYDNDADGKTHLYTSDWSEFGSADLGWTFENREGAMFRSDITDDLVASKGLVALYRYVNLSNQDHLYSLSDEEATTNTDYCLEGLAGWLPPQIDSLAGTTKLHRYRNSDNRHFYTITANSTEVQQGGWSSDDPESYIVFALDGSPDPLTLYQGPADASLAIDPACSSATVTVNGNVGQTPVSGNIGLTIGPNCTDPICTLSIATVNLTGDEFRLGDQTIDQLSIVNDGYFLGKWMIDNTYILPKQSVTVTARYNQNDSPMGLVITNSSGQLHGTLQRDYNGFTLIGDLTNPEGSLHLSLCGRVTGHPPVAVLTPPGPFQCNTPNAAQITFSSAQSYDLDNDIVHRSWIIDNVPQMPDVITLPTKLSLGPHVVTLTVADSRGAVSLASEAANVVDTTPPVLSVSATPSCIWPPNHKLVLYTLADTITAQTTDVCDASPTVRIAKVTSNQPSVGGGSGATSTDILYGNHAFCVRAERDGTSSDPRQYTVTVEAADRSGNKTTQQVVISVPHDQSEGQNCKVSNQQIVDDNDPRCVQ